MVGLRDEEIVDVHAEFTGVAGIESMFGVDESGLAAKLLRFGDDLQGERSLTAGFRAVDFDNAAAGESADTESGPNTARATRSATAPTLANRNRRNMTILLSLKTPVGEGLIKQRECQRAERADVDS